MLASIKSLFRKPSAMQLAQAELEEVERRLLAAHTALEWAKTEVVFRTQQARRLRRMVDQNALDWPITPLGESN